MVRKEERGGRGRADFGGSRERSTCVDAIESEEKRTVEVVVALYSRIAPD